MQTPGLLRRLGGVLYDALAVVALWLLASALVTTMFGDAGHGHVRLLLQCVSFTIVTAYFLWCWTHGGQTLAMKTWRIRVIKENGCPLSAIDALRRYLLAWFSVGFFGFGLLWALLDKDRQFLHDRLGHTRLIRSDTAGVSDAPSTPASPPPPPEKAGSAPSH